VPQQSVGEATAGDLIGVARSAGGEGAVWRQQRLFLKKYTRGLRNHLRKAVSNNLHVSRTGGPYAKKILGTRIDKGDKKEFNVQTFMNVDVLETFLKEVSTGRSVITQEGRSFLQEYFGMSNLAHLLYKRGIVCRFLSDADTAERIFAWLENKTGGRQSDGSGHKRRSTKGKRRPRHRPAGGRT
jgi:hypothetical protein